MQENQAENDLKQNLLGQQRTQSDPQFFRRSVNDFPVPRYDSPFQFGRKSYYASKAQQQPNINELEININQLKQQKQKDPKNESDLGQQKSVTFNLEKQDSPKLLDFVDDNKDAVQHLQIPKTSEMPNHIRTSAIGILKQSDQLQDQHQLHYQAERASKMQQVARQTIFLNSNINFNLDDVMGFEDNKLLIRGGGSEIKRYAINDNIIGALGENKNEIIEQKQSFEKPLFQKVSPYLAWFLVFVTTINASCISPWILSMPAEKYIRISWRFFMQGLMMIPFVLYERRTGDEVVKAKYKLSYIFNIDNFKKVYISSFTSSMWFTMTLFAQEWNFVSHSLVLGALQNFFFSIDRRMKGVENHNIENAGQGLVLGGVLCVLLDSYAYDPLDAPASTRSYKMFKLLRRQTWQRVILGNCTSILVSFMVFKMDKHQAVTRKTYPPNLAAMIICFLTAINMQMSAYFFSGSDFDVDHLWGWLGLFTSEQFSGFMFLSIILCFGNFLTSVLVSKLFEPIIPATAQLFEPVIATIIFQVVGVQIIPNGLSCIGYIFIVPGIFLIILGQHLIVQRIKQEIIDQERQEELQKLRQQQLQQEQLIKYQQNQIKEEQEIELEEIKNK